MNCLAPLIMTSSLQFGELRVKSISSLNVINSYLNINVFVWGSKMQLTKM